MKLRNKLFTMLLACIMLVAMAVPAFAAQSGNLTINGTTNGKTYDLYKVLDLTQSGDAYSYTVNEAFKDFNYQEGSTTIAAENLVAFIQEKSADSAALSNLAKALTKYALEKKDPPISPAKSVEAKGDSTSVTSLEYGYYVMNPRGGSSASTGYATMFSMNTLSGKDTTINVKAVYPTVDKKIKNKDDNSISANSASIGDDVTFTLTSKVPDLTGYKWYKFVAKDTLSEGLTYKELTSITVGGTKLADNAYTISKSTDGQTISFILKDLVKAKYAEGAKIVIKYKATVNENAAIGTTTGNSNTAKIEYSNDPSYTQNNEPIGDDFDKDEPKGESGESETATYTTSLTINKVDGEGHALTGAAFRITGDGVNQVVTTGDVYVKANDGTYWKLKDGTYTSTDPSTEGIDTSKYEDTSQKYKKETETTLNGKNSTINVEAFVDNQGHLTFAGLGAGTYKISETVVPDGYNKISDFDVEITFNNNSFTATATKNNTVTVGEDGRLSMNVVNQSGSVLPSTGGIGTTIFYILGGILVVGAGVLLITRRRINADK